MEDNIFVAILVLLMLIMFFISLNIRLVKVDHEAVIERLGAFHRVVGPGIHMLIPFYERMVEVMPVTPIDQVLGTVTITTVIKDTKVYCYAPRKCYNETVTMLLETVYPMSGDVGQTVQNDEIDPQITSYMATLGLEITKIVFNNRQ
jgi:hypothetical protein